jgi:hypothetical protein
VLKLSSKTKGEYAELVFASEACKQGFTVLFPNGDNALYDFVVDIKGKLSRIQVKSSSTSVYSVSHGSHYTKSNRSRYKHIDFFAFVCLTTLNVYIIPLSKVKEKGTISIRDSKHLLYKNAWHLLKA